MSVITRFGFLFGSMSVTRTAIDNKDVAIVSVATPKNKFSIRATKTGNVRFYDEQGNVTLEEAYKNGKIRK